MCFLVSEKWNVGLTAPTRKTSIGRESPEAKRQHQFNDALSQARRLTVRLAGMNQGGSGKPVSETQRSKCRRELEAALAKIDVRALAETAAGNAPFFTKMTAWKTTNPKAPISLEERARKALEEMPTAVLQAGLVEDSAEVMLAKATLVIAPGGGRAALEDGIQKLFSPPPVLGPGTAVAKVINDILIARRKSGH